METTGRDRATARDRAIVRYNPGRVLERRQNDPERREKASRDAQAVADYLKQTYGAIVFGIGSLFEPGRRFSSRSDIDLVVEGVEPEVFFRAGAEAQSLTDIPLDIIPREAANELVEYFVRETGVRL